MISDEEFNEFISKVKKMEEKRQDMISEMMNKITESLGNYMLSGRIDLVEKERQRIEILKEL